MPGTDKSHGTTRPHRRSHRYRPPPLHRDCNLVSYAMSTTDMVYAPGIALRIRNTVSCTDMVDAHPRRRHLDP
eukprot:1901537-Rhodomonas_salina.1